MELFHDTIYYLIYSMTYWNKTGDKTLDQFAFAILDKTVT